ncbi:hypothetical protein D8682_08435 [Buttiauxella sp. 3AFRM03]|uniref:hypothetical protein n=1 Tax=Buttiauxella sp. 3AFRM03 TaxID=2479367 RepID=UPI000EF7D2FC|nr:hypothetical protein [Buttiauxella sp. 3AFRM03]AYN27017.1 hypothetical protein D8682_08435 [Buttiauxella sp. 3AFRM03]
MAFDLIKYLTDNAITHSISEHGAINIPDDLDLADNKYVTALPENLTVGGKLCLSGTHITELPENLKVGGDIGLYRTKITSLSGGLRVGRDLDLSETQITTLPRNLVVNGRLNLRGSQVTILPDGLMVGDWLDLCDTQITILPNYFTCSSLYLDPEHFSNVVFRKNCGNNNRTIFAVRANETFYIAAGYFYGLIEQFEDAVDRKYSGETAEAYKQAGRDCLDGLKEKLSTKPQ